MNLFFGNGIRSYLKKIEKCQNILLIEQVIRFLHEFSDLFYLSPGEQQQLLIKTYQVYLTNCPRIENVVILYPLVFSHFLNSPELLIKCSNYYIDNVHFFIKSLIKKEALETNFKTENSNLLTCTWYLSFALGCTLNFYTSNPYAVTPTQEKNLTFYRHSFLNHCKNLGYLKINLAALFIHLIQLGMKKKLPLPRLMPILKDLIYYLNYNEDINCIKIAHRTSEDLQCFQLTGNLLDEMTSFYQDIFKNHAEFNETKCFFDSIFSNIYEETKKTIPVNYLVNSANYLMKIDTPLAYHDLIKLLFLFKNQGLLDHPHFLVIYNKVIKVASTTLQVVIEI